MKVIILAAGLGTRMGELTRQIPKAMVSVCGKPAIIRIVENLHSAGFGELIAVTGYLEEQIHAELGDGSSRGLAIEYVHQRELKGTAQAMLLTRGIAENGPVMLTFGDILTSPKNYSQAKEVFEHEKLDALLGVRQVDDPYKGAAVYTDSQMRVSRVIEKPPRGTSTTPWNSAGLFCFSPQVWSYLVEVPLSPRGEYEIADAISQMLVDGLRIGAMEMTGIWKDLGTPGDLREAEQLLAHTE